MSWLRDAAARWRLRWWLLLRRDAQVVDWLQERTQRLPHDRQALAALGFHLGRGGRLSEAAQVLERLVACDPASAASWFNLGFVRDQLGDWPQATQAFETALSLDPTLDRAWFGLGLVQGRQGQRTQAVAALRKVTELQPLSPHGWMALARQHVALAEHTEARRVLDHLRTFEPRYAARLEEELHAAAATGSGPPAS